MTDKFLNALANEDERSNGEWIKFPSLDTCAALDIPESYRISLKVKPATPRMMEAITKRATIKKFDRGKNRQEQEISEDRLIRELGNDIVEDWQLTVKQWRFWVPSNPPAFSTVDGVTENDLIPYSAEMFVNLTRRSLSLSLGANVIEEATNPKNFTLVDMDDLTTEDEVKN